MTIVRRQINFKFLGAVIGLAIVGIAGLIYWRKKRRF
jgi:LPXTG-motif cell wall-anchored protein